LFDFWYRGERDSVNWKLVPKVFRQNTPLAELAGYERDLTNRFRVLAHSRHKIDFNYENYGRSLSLMQHYGLPTRLLDWSMSPLVALFFAVGTYNYRKDQEPIEACIWILDPYGLNSEQFGDATTASIEGGSVRKFLRPAFNGYVPPIDHPDREDYLATKDAHYKAAMASEFDARIFVQQGAFTIHTEATPLNESRFSKYLRKVVVPASAVRSIATELKILGMRKSTIFPDLVNLSEDLVAREFLELR
jgi:hypothetical protein